MLKLKLLIILFEKPDFQKWRKRCNTCVSLFQALCQCGRLIEKVGGRRTRSGRERGGFHSRIPLAADPAYRLRAFSIVLTDREPGTGYTSVYFSFKIFSRFWLVKTTRIIHHNQLLFTKFGKNLRHFESMTSKVQPAKNYWTDDVKSAARCRLLNRWPRNLGTWLCYIWWAEKQRAY